MNEKILDSQKRVLKAGGITFRDNPDGSKEVLLIFRKKLNDWTFPKGAMEAGEDSQATAIRETKEETGIDTQIIGELPSYEYYDDIKDEPVIVFMYLLKPLSHTTHIEYAGDKLKWVSVKEALNLLTHQNLKDYLEANKDRI